MAEKEIGKITHYFGKIEVGIIELIDSIKVGDTIHIKGDSSDFNQTLDSMQINHQNVETANSGDGVGVKFNEKVRVNDIVYKVEEE